MPPHEEDLPDLRRDRLAPVGPALARRVGDAALALTWRVVGPARREPYVLQAPPEGLRRVYYEADDGWRAPLYHLPPRPGARGEPVLLAHGVGGTHRDFTLDPAHSLATTLSAAGYAVYLFEHRGDPGALAPPSPRPFHVDDIALRDLDAALRVVAEDAGWPGVLCVGHGLGAQALYLRLALHGRDGIVALVSIAAAVTFPRHASATRAGGLLSALLPDGWALPARRWSQVVSPFLVSGEGCASPGTAGPVARAWMRYAASDLHGGVLRQLRGWVHEGRLTDATGRVDVVAALPRLPALVIEPDADPGCPPGSTTPAAEALGAHHLRLTGGWGHLDPLLGRDAPTHVHAEIVKFLEVWRHQCGGRA